MSKESWEVITIGFDNLAKNTVLKENDEYRVTFSGTCQVAGTLEEFKVMDCQIKVKDKILIIKRYR